MRIHRVAAAALFAATALTVLAYRLGRPAPPPRPMPSVHWAGCGVTIAHAFGAIANRLYTNTREAFDRSLARGYRIFEVDFRFTSDHQVVLAHDWYTPGRTTLSMGAPTLETFLATPIYDSLTTIDLPGFAHMVRDNPDVRWVLDFKEGVPPLIGPIAEAVRGVDPTGLDRLIPQLQFQSDLPLVRAAHDFPAIIYTLYATNDSDAEVERFVQHEGIPIVVMSEARFRPFFVRRLREAGVNVYVHTVNTQMQVDLYRDWGVNGVMSDILPPDSTCAPHAVISEPTE